MITIIIIIIIIIKRTNRDHPRYCIIKTGQNTE